MKQKADEFMTLISITTAVDLVSYDMHIHVLVCSYLLEFDDDEEDGSLPRRVVPFHKVVALPEGHRQ